jgi:hypothetical protein
MSGLHLVTDGRRVDFRDITRGLDLLLRAATYLRDVYQLEGWGWFSWAEWEAYQILNSLAEDAAGEIARCRLSV